MRVILIPVHLLINAHMHRHTYEDISMHERIYPFAHTHLH